MRDLSALFGPWALPRTVADAVRWTAIEAEHMVATWAPRGSERWRAAHELRLAICDAPDHLLTVGWPRPSSAQAACASCEGTGTVFVSQDPELEEGSACPACDESELEMNPCRECSCHINPPCTACVENFLWCPTCHWELADGVPEAEEPCEDCGGTGTREWASCARCRRLCDPDDLEPSAAGWTCDACRDLNAASSPHPESPCP